MAYTVLGYATLAVFVVVLALTLFRKINLPIQTVLILITLVNVAAACSDCHTPQRRTNNLISLAHA